MYLTKYFLFSNFYSYSIRDPDPDGAALTIELLQIIIANNNFKVDTSELRKQGEEMKHKLNNLIKSIKQQQEQFQLIHDGKHDPIMYS